MFEAGDEVISGLMGFAKEFKPQSAHFSAIGAFEEATQAYFDWRTRKYEDIPVEEQVEVLVLSGHITRKDTGEPNVHAHVVVGRCDGSTRGGHLKKAHVRPTLELVLVEYPQHLHRSFVPGMGLALIKL